MVHLRIKMQYLFSILILFFICTNKDTFAQNMNAETVETQLFFDKESGFLTKEEGMAFLLFNSLIDTFSSFSKLKYWDKINSTDTIGRYYRIENSDNYMMCLPHSLDFFGPMYLIIEVTSHGKLVKSEKFDFGNAHKWNTYYKDFFQKEKFWGIVAQGGYNCGGYLYGNLYLFKELLPQDSITYIRFFEREISHKNIFRKKKIIKRYYPAMKIEGNELIINYKLNRGKVKTDKAGHIIFEYSRTNKKISIKYFYEDERWNTNNTAQLDKIKQFMKVKPYQVIN